jgi:hypothetical protein
MKTILDEFPVNAFTIDRNQPNCPAVAVSIHSFYLYHLPVYHSGCELLGFCAEGLTFLRAVYAIEPDLLTLTTMHNGNRVTIGHADYFTLPGKRELRY